MHGWGPFDANSTVMAGFNPATHPARVGAPTKPLSALADASAMGGRLKAAHDGWCRGVIRETRTKLAHQRHAGKETGKNSSGKNTICADGRIARFPAGSARFRNETL
jgi:hypothetical protein